MRFLRNHFVLLALAALAAVPMLAQDRGSEFVGFDGTITKPGNYVLSQDIRLGASRDIGIHIKASGVTLDLNGHEIMGPGGMQGMGIVVEGAQGVKVTNGNVSNLHFGVVVHDSANVVVSDLRIRGEDLPVVSLPPEVGVMVLQSRNVVVKGNSIANTGLGIFVRGGHSWGNRIEHNTITAGANGRLGICYNPGPPDDQGPHGDLVESNFVSGFAMGLQMKDVAHYNVIRNNVIAFVDVGMDLQNDTHTEVDNVLIQLR